MNDINDLQDIELRGREEIARKIGRILATSSTNTDRQAALELAKVLVEDVAVSVRSVLSDELKKCNFLPKEIVKTIATDIEQVSIPFIIASEAIDDEMLEEILANAGEETQAAVASRKGLSEAISFAISDTGCEPAVETLVGNETANVAVRSCDRVIARFPENKGLMESLASRSDLPAEIVEKLIFKVSKKYGEYLSDKFGLSSDYASYLVSLASRQVFSRALEMSPNSDIENYLRQLHEVKPLGSDLLLNYLQNGHVKLFMVALSIVTDLPYDAVQDRLKTGDKKILARLLEVAGFSKSVVGVLLIAFERLSRM